MTLEQGFRLFMLATEPPSPTVVRVKRVWSELGAGAGIVNLVLPDVPKEGTPTTTKA